MRRTFACRSILLFCFIIICFSWYPPSIQAGNNSFVGQYKIFLPSTRTIGFDYPVPPYTRSYYIGYNDLSRVRQLGCNARDRAETGVVILAFGAIRDLFPSQSVPRFRYGVRLLVGSRGDITLYQVEELTNAFANGYYLGCSSPSTPNPAPALTIVVGTNNAKIGGTGDNPNLNATTGQYWAEMVTRLSQRFTTPTTEAPNGLVNVRVAGGIDAEWLPDAWSSYAATRSWAEGYNSFATRPYYNYGSCEDCPRTAPQPWSAVQVNALQRAYGLSWDLQYALPLPQIYYVPYAYEWFNVRRYARETYNRTVNYVGPLTPCGYSPNCDFNDPRRWQDFLPVVTNDFLPPKQGYMAFYDTLRSSSRPDGATNSYPQTIQPVWLTDMHGDD